MEMYSYSVDKEYLKSRNGVDSMVGKKALSISHGYVFADNYEEAIRIMEKEYPSDEYTRHHIHLTKSNIIAM